MGMWQSAKWLTALRRLGSLSISWMGRRSRRGEVDHLSQGDCDPLHCVAVEVVEGGSYEYELQREGPGYRLRMALYGHVQIDGQ